MAQTGIEIVRIFCLVNVTENENENETETETEKGILPILLLLRIHEKIRSLSLAVLKSRSERGRGRWRWKGPIGPLPRVESLLASLDPLRWAAKAEKDIARETETGKGKGKEKENHSQTRIRSYIPTRIHTPILLSTVNIKNTLHRPQVPTQATPIHTLTPTPTIPILWFLTPIIIIIITVNLRVLRILFLLLSRMYTPIRTSGRIRVWLHPFRPLQARRLSGRRRVLRFPLLVEREIGIEIGKGKENVNLPREQAQEVQQRSGVRLLSRSQSRRVPVVAPFRLLRHPISIGFIHSL